MRWGLLIYNGPTLAPASVPCPPNVLLIQAEKFVESLRDIGFGDLIRRLRNERVHGGA
jgi:hypothetical protein